MIRIAGIVNESIVDGEGYRLAVFTQGCPHHCKGCHNPQTWDMNGGEMVDEQQIIDALGKNPLLQGVTFSGGEPFMQPEALTVIAKAAHDMDLDVWSWTGFKYEDLLADEKRRGLLKNVDILVDGPFVLEKRNLGFMFRGSENQRVIDVKASMACGNVVLWAGLRDDV